MGKCALSIFAGNKIVKEPVAVVWFILTEGPTCEVFLQKLLPNLLIPGHSGWFQPLLHRRQVNLFPIVGDEVFCGWLRVGLARGDHVLIAQSEHSIAVYAVMNFIAVTQLMGYPLL